MLLKMCTNTKEFKKQKENSNPCQILRDYHWDIVVNIRNRLTCRGMRDQRSGHCRFAVFVLHRLFRCSPVHKELSG